MTLTVQVILIYKSYGLSVQRLVIPQLYQELILVEVEGTRIPVFPPETTERFAQAYTKTFTVYTWQINQNAISTYRNFQADFNLADELFESRKLWLNSLIILANHVL